MLRTYNFRTDPYDHFVSSLCNETFYDHRNDISCILPSGKMDCYINYLEFLNLHLQDWKTYGYLDLGLIPLSMPPSFIRAMVSTTMTEIAEQLHLPYVAMPPVSFLKSSCPIAYDDLWVYRRDVAKIMSCDIMETSALKFLRWCADEIPQFNEACVGEISER